MVLGVTGEGRFARGFLAADNAACAWPVDERRVGVLPGAFSGRAILATAGCVGVARAATKAAFWALAEASGLGLALEAGLTGTLGAAFGGTLAAGLEATLALGFCARAANGAGLATGAWAASGAFLAPLATGFAPARGWGFRGVLVAIFLAVCVGLGWVFNCCLLAEFATVTRAGLAFVASTPVGVWGCAALAAPATKLSARTGWVSAKPIICKIVDTNTGRPNKGRTVSSQALRHALHEDVLG